MKMIKQLTILVLFLLSSLPAQAVRSAHTEASLVADKTAFVAGETVAVGLHLKMDSHWHTYWKNPGDSGLPTKIKWTLPEGFTASQIQWPAPYFFDVSGIVSFAYENEVLLITEITAPANLAPGQQITLNAKASWLACKEACIPGRAELSISLPSAQENKLSDLAPLFEATRKTFPKKAEGWASSHRIEGTQLFIELEAPANTPNIESARFFPNDSMGFELASPTTWTPTASGYQLTLTLSEEPPEFETLSGVLRLGDSSIELESPSGAIQSTDAQTNDAQSIESPTPDDKGLHIYLLWAFLGGIILNAMPCVFPVISLKVLGFVQQANHDRSKVMKHAGMFTLGVLVSFWALAALVVGLQSAGAGVGWGFQLQHPQVVLALILLFTLIAINLFGVFEIGVGLTAAGSNLTAKDGYSGSFFSGLLATVVATPCTAPFLAPAIGFAFAQPGPVIFAIFTAVGLGMALPYALLSSSSKLMDKMPRPGPWMETLKQAMGFIMLATAVWLAGVYRLQAGPNHLQALLYGLVLLGIGAWIYGRWGAIHRSVKSKRIALVLFILSIVGAFSLPGKATDTPGGSTAKPADALWQAWSPEALDEALTSGKPVFVDFTAAWCLSCQVNKKTTLRRASVEEAFKVKDVVLLEADWTDKNEPIRKALAEFGRSGVPVYALYPANETKPQLLPEVLTPKIVIDALENLDGE